MAVATNSLINIEGTQITEGAFVVIFKTEWNAAVTDELTEACVKFLTQCGIKSKVFLVPGAVELAFAIQSYWRMHGQSTATAPHAFIAFGCVIKGDTPHFDYVCKYITEGILQLNLELPVPTIFGVLTVLNQQQANERIGGLHGHKGIEAAAAAVKMISLQSQFYNG